MQLGLGVTLLKRRELHERLALSLSIHFINLSKLSLAVFATHEPFLVLSCAIACLPYLPGSSR